MSMKFLGGLCLVACTLAGGPLLADEYASIRDKLQICFTCHGEDGALPPEGKYPILAGQHFYYLYSQLKDFNAERRQNPEMSPMAANLTNEEMQALAKFFSEQSWPSTGFVSDPAKAEKAELSAMSGECVQCHLGGYEGASGVPRLAGQQSEYLKQTMLDLKTRARANAPDKSSLMNVLSDEDIDYLANYLGGL
ncbi:MAG: c-type cytochrome [Gammaproteobacteria bacterium]|nr:c-type cytochrome [Gammaproteobacteria bacterium]MCI0590188.1 c-type cytochrome [Gammaproteobacteria bacterium]